MTTSNLYALPITVTCLISALLLLLQHYALLPYARHIARKELPTLTRYVLGVLALNGPLVILFAFLPQGLTPLIVNLAIIAVTTTGGLAVLAAYGLDIVVERLAQWYENEFLKDFVL